MFTVIVPTHNRPVLLQRTLRSLIAQTFRDFMVIVVDDAASYIPPFAELAELNGRYTYIIRSGDSGPAQSRNMGLALTGSRYTFFLDDDDTLEPGHLQSLADHIANRNPALLFCDFRVVNEDRICNPPQFLSTETLTISSVTRDSVFVRNRIPNSCIVYRSDVLTHIRYDTTMKIYEDWDFVLHCLQLHPLEHVPVSSVVIHKSRATAPENMRRGNTRDDLIVQVMLSLYKRHPALNAETRQARQALMATAGVSVALEDC